MPVNCCEIERKETAIDRDLLPAVLIVDDQPPFRAVARTVAKIAFAGAEITETETGEDAVRQAEAGTLEPVADLERFVTMDRVPE